MLLIAERFQLEIREYGHVADCGCCLKWKCVSLTWNGEAGIPSSTQDSCHINHLVKKLTVDRTTSIVHTVRFVNSLKPDLPSLIPCRACIGVLASVFVTRSQDSRVSRTECTVSITTAIGNCVIQISQLLGEVLV